MNTALTTRSLVLAAATAALIGAGSASAEVLLFAGAGGVVHELNTETGQVAFRGVCSGPVSSMVVHEGVLYLGDASGTIYAFDVATNAVTDAFSVPGDANAMSWIGTRLVVGDTSGTINYIDRDTHAVVNTTTAPGTDITAIGLDAGGLFVGGHSSIALRSHIGSNSFQFFAACGSQIQSMAFGTDTMYLGGTHFFGDMNGTIYNFDKFEGGVSYTGTHDVPSDTTAVVFSDHLLYIAGSDGVIHEMDPETGIISRTFETGIDIQAMTPQSGQVSCPADYDVSGDLNFIDVSTFVNLFSNQLAPGDTNGDGEFNYFDVSAFLSIYLGGC